LSISDAHKTDFEARSEDDRLVRNENHFFDQWGRRLKIEEMQKQ
jgi:hypothetical protein